MEIAKPAQGLTTNLLGIIGPFVVLVYGLAAFVLEDSSPHLSESQRWSLTLFLVTFPIVMLTASYPLVTNHRWALYSPGDFSSDEVFFQAFTRLKKKRKIETELASLVPESSEKPTRKPSEEERSPITNHVPIAEDLVFRKLKTAIGVKIRRYFGIHIIGVDILLNFGGRKWQHK